MKFIEVNGTIIRASVIKTAELCHYGPIYSISIQYLNNLQETSITLTKDEQQSRHIFEKLLEELNKE